MVKDVTLRGGDSADVRCDLVEGEFGGSARLKKELCSWKKLFLCELLCITFHVLAFLYRVLCVEP